MFYVFKQSILRHTSVLTKPYHFNFGPRHWAAVLLIGAQLVIIAAGIAHLQAQGALAPTDFRINPDGTASVSGLVLSSRNDCRIDSTCNFDLRIQDGKTLRVVYHPGEGTVQCAERLRTASQLESIRPGTEITAYGQYEMYQGQRYLNVCAIPDAYLTITHQL